MDELASRSVVFEEYDQPGIKTDERGVFDAGRFKAAWVKDPTATRWRSPRCRASLDASPTRLAETFKR
jgi:hypothetical protein